MHFVNESVKVDSVACDFKFANDLTDTVDFD
jgi:hypothetical protein